jgi:hypothetical protein
VGKIIIVNADALGPNGDRDIPASERLPVIGIAIDSETRKPVDLTGGVFSLSLPVALTPPTISGSLVAGETITFAPGSFTNSPTGYVYRLLADGKDVALPTGAVSYALTTSEVGKALRLLVLAVNASGASQWSRGSATAGVTASASGGGVVTPPPTPTAPDAPMLTVTPGDGKNTLSWIDGANNGAAITKHKLYTSASSAGPFAYAGDIATASPYQDTAPNGTAKFYRLSAVNSAGEGPQSDTKSGTPVAAAGGAQTFISYKAQTGAGHTGTGVSPGGGDATPAGSLPAKIGLPAIGVYGGSQSIQSTTPADCRTDDNSSESLALVFLQRLYAKAQRPAGTFVEAHLAKDSQAGFESCNYAVGILNLAAEQTRGTEIRVQVPGMWQGANLQQAAAGAYNASYDKLADSLLAFSQLASQGFVRCRVAQEQNRTDRPGDWPWLCGGDTTLNGYYVTTVRLIKARFDARAAAAGKPGFFIFDWSPNNGTADWRPSYPGDDYFTTNGVRKGRIVPDVYQGNGASANATNGAAAFIADRDCPNGLAEIIAFAGNPALRPTVAGVAPTGAIKTGIGEWGVKNENYSDYHKGLIDFANASGMESLGYWNSDGDYPSTITGGNNPQTASYIDYWWGASHNAVLTPVALPMGGAGQLDPSSGGSQLSYTADFMSVRNDTNSPQLAVFGGPAITGVQIFAGELVSGGVTGPQVGFINTDNLPFSAGYLGATGGTGGFDLDAGTVVGATGQLGGPYIANGRVAFAFEKATGKTWFHSTGQPWNGSAANHPDGTPVGGLAFPYSTGAAARACVMLKPGDVFTIKDPSIVSLTPVSPTLGPNLVTNQNLQDTTYWAQYAFSGTITRSASDTVAFSGSQNQQITHNFGKLPRGKYLISHDVQMTAGTTVLKDFVYDGAERGFAMSPVNPDGTSRRLTSLITVRNDNDQSIGFVVQDGNPGTFKVSNIAVQTYSPY